MTDTSTPDAVVAWAGRDTDPADPADPAGTAAHSDPSWLSAAQRARLTRLCATIARDRVAAEDLAQETLLEAWRHRHKLVDPSGATPWLNAIARNVCRRRAGARRTESLDAHDERASVLRDDIGAVLEREELVVLLDRALALLPAETREVLVARYVHERSHAEIADLLGVTADAVSMRLTRGKQRLRTLLETTFAEDSIAEGWATRGATGWRPTRLRCAVCSGLTLQQRKDSGEAVVAFRCTACGPHGLSVRFALDVPLFSRLVGGLQRPSAILGRASDWSLAYWSPGVAAGQVGCVRCGRTTPVRTYTRPDISSWTRRHGWYVDCERCRERLSESVAGLALSLPAVRAARRRHPRLLAMPAREVVRDGRPAMVVSFATPNGAEEVAAVFSAETHRLLHVVAPAAATGG